MSGVNREPDRVRIAIDLATACTLDQGPVRIALLEFFLDQLTDRLVSHFKTPSWNHTGR